MNDPIDGGNLRNEDDIQAREIARQTRPAALGSRLVAGSSGAAPNATPAATSTRVTADGRSKQLWTPGDPWTADYYFGSAPVKLVNGKVILA